MRRATAHPIRMARHVVPLWRPSLYARPAPGNSRCNPSGDRNRRDIGERG